MLISHKHKFVFIHNPKVGGTSIRTALLPFCEGNPYHGKGIIDSEVQDIAHLRVDQWTTELVDAYTDGYYFFGVVKDPVERYRSAMSELQFQHPDFLASFAMRNREDVLLTLLNEAVARNDWRFCHFCPQWTYFGLDPKQLLPRIEIFKLEWISTWWSQLQLTLGLDLGTPTLENIRPSFYKPDELQEDTMELIGSLYSEDFKAFSYSNPKLGVVRHKTSAQKIDHIAKFGHNGYEFLLSNKREVNAAERQGVKLNSAMKEWMTGQLFLDAN